MNEAPSRKREGVLSWYHACMLGYAAVALGSLVVAYLLGVFTGAHYMPTTDSRVVRMLALAELKEGERFLDIGSGDGRLVMAAARRGAHAVGYELNPLLVLWSRARIRQAGLEAQAQVHWRDFWRTSLSGFDVVAVYGIGRIMGALEAKAERELAPGARVVSNTFRFPTRKATREEEGLYRYDV